MRKNIRAFVFLIILVLIIVVYFSYRSVVRNQPSELVNIDTSIPTIITKSVFSGTASAILSGAPAIKTVLWQTSSYPAGVGVDINLIRKTSNSPIKFVDVRVIATNTVNDGEESWTPLALENTNDLYVEVLCSSIYKFDTCRPLGEAIKVN